MRLFPHIQLILAIPGRTIVPESSWAYNYSLIRRKQAESHFVKIFDAVYGINGAQ